MTFLRLLLLNSIEVCAEDGFVVSRWLQVENDVMPFLESLLKVRSRVCVCVGEGMR